MHADEIKRLDKQHVMHPWSVNDARDPDVLVDAEGVYLIDDRNRRLLDFSSQLKAVTLGYKDARVVEAIRRQAATVCYVSPGYAVESRSKLAQRLAGVTPGDIDKFFFTLAGADANENAVKMARAFTGRSKVLSYYRSYHGNTYGAISLTGDPRRPPVEPGIPGIARLLNPYCYRCPFGLCHPACELHCARHVEEIIQYETPDTVAAVILEPVVGAGGVIVPPDGYLQRVKAICDAYGILLIADEVMTGFGRTGQWFGVDHWQVVPDLITMAKGLTSAYVPLGAVGLSRRISDALDTRMLYCGLTYSGHPLACAAGLATLEALEQDGLIERSRRLGQVLKAALEDMQSRHACIGDVRGLGLFACLELVKDRTTKEPLVPYNATGRQAAMSKEISRRLKEKGVYTPMRWMFLSISPPLSISETQLCDGLAVIDEVLGEVDGTIAR